MCKTSAFTESQLREEDKVCVWYADPSPFLTSPINFLKPEKTKIVLWQKEPGAPQSREKKWIRADMGPMSLSPGSAGSASVTGPCLVPSLQFPGWSENGWCFFRFDNGLALHLGPPPDDLPSYSANYSDDFKTWRPVEISRLVSKQQNKISDGRICASAAAPKTCSIERVLRKTGRFQKWLQAKRLTPDLVRVSVLAVGGRRTGGTIASPHLSLSGQKEL